MESAVVAESVSLETKLCLIEAAVQSGFADTAKAQALLAQALDATCKTLEEKLAATEKMIQGQAALLSAKLALIETAVKEGFADDQKRQELLQKAVETLRGLQQVLAPTA